MKVRVRAFARFREIFGSEQAIDLPEGAGLDTLLRRLAESREEGHVALFDGEGRLLSHVVLMHNRKQVRHAAVSGTALSDGDEVAVFPPVAGG